METKRMLVCGSCLLGLLMLGQTKKNDTKEISAYVIKVIKNVNMRTPTTGWQKALPLSTLKSGYELKTDKGSFAMILFADQSKLIVREKSIVMIKGEVRGKEILSRSVHMDRGSMVFNVKKAETEQFRFSSPISVASIRGTQGDYTTGGGSDSLTILEGLADFSNSFSGKKMSVGSGQTGVADSSGNLNVGAALLRTLRRIESTQTEGEAGGSGDTSNPLGALTPDFGRLVSKHASMIRVNLASLHGKAVEVHMFYRKPNTSAFTDLPLTMAAQTAAGKLQPENVKYPRLEYYLSIKMTDGSTLVLPQNGSNAPASVTVDGVKHELRVPGQTGSLQKKVVVLKWTD
jgi:hypothetical protein